ISSPLRIFSLDVVFPPPWPFIGSFGNPSRRGGTPYIAGNIFRPPVMPRYGTKNPPGTIGRTWGAIQSSLRGGSRDPHSVAHPD
ncbi:MAG: hypothetical protein KAS94_12925, partial [Desulfobulbaceae bacterium]|nr:hypothetical protein [Desulfobulbaceae bacterium]